MSQLCTLVIGLIVLCTVHFPANVIWKINMFAFGGLESAFVWVFLLGMFWKKANKTGAILSMLGGTVSYCVTMALGIEVMHLHQIVIGMAVSLVLIGDWIENRKTLFAGGAERIFLVQFKTTPEAGKGLSPALF